MRFKKGDRVRVYQDPITRKDFEGDATLSKRVDIYCESGYEFWEVTFDSERGETYLRMIHHKERLTAVDA